VPFEPVFGLLADPDVARTLEAHHLTMTDSVDGARAVSLAVRAASEGKRVLAMIPNEQLSMAINAARRALDAPRSAEGGVVLLLGGLGDHGKQAQGVCFQVSSSGKQEGRPWIRQRQDDQECRTEVTAEPLGEIGRDQWSCCCPTNHADQVERAKAGASEVRGLGIGEARSQCRHGRRGKEEPNELQGKASGQRQVDQRHDETRGGHGEFDSGQHHSGTGYPGDQTIGHPSTDDHPRDATRHHHDQERHGGLTLSQT
jgi:hypothetical protein